MDYSHFTCEDFVLDPYFRRWVGGELPPEDTFWETFRQGHPEKEEEIRQARFLVAGLGMEDAPLSDEDILARTETLQNRITPVRSLRWWIAAAASVAVLAVGGLGWYTYREPIRQTIGLTPAGQQEECNTSSARRNITLPDGSVVTLEPGSRICYSRDFARRNVQLDGEAFFNVVRMPERPFQVYTGQVTTRVLGTSFSVRSASGDVVVKVVTGKVSVAAPEAAGEHIVLLPNQMGVYRKATERLSKTLVEQPLLLHTSPDVSFHFQDTPVSEVFTRLQQSYGVPILYDSEALARCTVTAPLGNESLYEKLDLICRVLRASYEVVDAQIVITSRGCAATSPSSDVIP